MGEQGEKVGCAHDAVAVEIPQTNAVEENNWQESSMTAPSTDTHQIGSDYNGVGEFDGVRLSSRAMCAAEIAAIYQQMTGVRIVTWQEVEP